MNLVVSHLNYSSSWLLYREKYSCDNITAVKQWGYEWCGLVKKFTLVVSFFFIWASKINVCHWFAVSSVSVMRNIAAFLTGAYTLHHKSGRHVRELITVQVGLLWVPSVRISSKSSSEKETRPKGPSFSAVFVLLEKTLPFRWLWHPLTSAVELQKCPDSLSTSLLQKLTLPEAEAQSHAEVLVAPEWIQTRDSPPSLAGNAKSLISAVTAPAEVCLTLGTPVRQTC